MKWIVIFVLLYTVAFGKKLNKHLQEYFEEGRVWGFVEEYHDHKRVGGVESEENYDDQHEDNVECEEQNKALNGSAIRYDPCKVYNPMKPNFEAAGRRISEAKCMEYLWGVGVREEKLKRLHECREKIENNSCEANRRKVPSIIGGSSLYNSSEYPHMGALGWSTRNDREYVFKCGSSLISNKFILTAAHCSRAPVDDYIIESKPKIVRLSNTNLSNPDGAYDVEIVNIILHPNYTSPKRYYDIALMELEFELIFSDIIQPACLWTKYDTAELGDVAKITGWGVLSFGSRESSIDLQVAEVNLIDSKLCDDLLLNSRSKNWQGMVEHQICAGKLEGGVDACQGDSGGPLQIVKYKSDRGALFNIIGVTSFGIACGQPNLPGIYTRVSSFIDWIEDVVWK